MISVSICFIIGSKTFFMVLMQSTLACGYEAANVTADYYKTLSDAILGTYRHKKTRLGNRELNESMTI